MALSNLNNQLSPKESNPIKEFITGQPIGIVIFVGILVGWVLCFLLINFIIGGSIEDMLNMDEFAFRIILFISFPRGAILGTAVVVLYRKSIKDAESKNSLKKSQPKDSVTKLKELKELMDAGVLTQEEFDAQKEKILNSPQ